MEKKKILIVSRSFFPDNSARSHRTTELAKEFSRQGHDVTVITTRQEDVHNTFEADHNLTIRDFGTPAFKSVEIKGKGFERLIRRFLVRFPRLLFEYPDIELTWLVRNALKNESGYDLLISIAVPYPVHWGVAWARNQHNKIADVWIADCGDPYCGLENDSFQKPFYFSFVEKWFSRKADFITIPFEGAKKAYFSEFHPKIRVIPQGFSVPELNNSLTAGKNNEPTFAYFGTITSYLHFALPFLKRLNEIDKNFKFIVYTKRKDIFTNALNQQTLKKCEIREYTERDSLFRELSIVDFLLHFPYEKSSQRSLKLIDYAFMEKPILSFKDDRYSEIALEEFLEGDYSKKYLMEHPDNFKIENVCSKFLQLSNHRT